MSAINRIEKSRARRALKGTSLRKRTRAKGEPILRVVHAANRYPGLVHGTWFTGLGGQQIHLHPDLLDETFEEHERMYMHRLRDLFLKPDEVWQDHDPRHGDHWRYLKYHFDYMLVASVDIRDPRHVHIFRWFALEYDMPTQGRPPQQQVRRQQQGILIHDRQGSIRSSGAGPVVIDRASPEMPMETDVNCSL